MVWGLMIPRQERGRRHSFPLTLPFGPLRSPCVSLAGGTQVVFEFLPTPGQAWVLTSGLRIPNVLRQFQSSSVMVFAGSQSARRKTSQAGLRR